MGHRVGIIGLGTVGGRFVDLFARHPGFDLVAAWDADPQACVDHRASVEIAADADAVIAAADAVYIAVPPLHHREYVEACVATGTAVFCEKPLGIDVDESARLVELVEASGLPAGVNFVFGAAPAATALIDAVVGGELGDVVRADLRLHFARWPRAWHANAQWLTMRDQGGWMREVGSHFLFLAGRLLGPLAVDSATVTYPDGPGGVHAEIDAFARCTSPVAPLLVVGTSEGAGPDVVDFTVRGTDRSMRIQDWYRLQTTTGDGWDDQLGDDRRALADAAYVEQLGELATLLDGGRSRLATFGEALAVQQLVETMLAP